MRAVHGGGRYCAVLDSESIRSCTRKITPSGPVLFKPSIGGEDGDVGTEEE